MRIVLVGGGTGGHFYPLIAISQGIEEICKERTLLEPELYYLGPAPFDATALLERDIIHVPSPAGKMRRYGSIMNVFGFVSTFFGIIKSIFLLYDLYPDVIFSTGGYAAFPTLYAARILNIPVVVYDADATPGRVTLWSAKFARWIGTAHPEAATHFPENVRHKIARVGHPIRLEIEQPAKEGGYEFLHLDPSVPAIFVMGGSQGAQAINNVVLDSVKDLVTRYNVIHQAGTANAKEVDGISKLILKDSANAQRYRTFGLLNTLAMRMAAGISAVVITRAGSGTIFEIASWGIPAIIIPIPEDVSHDQTENAFSYSRAGAAVVIEQRNLTQHVLTSEIDRLMNNPDQRALMAEAAKEYSRPQAAKKIANILLETALEHETV
ncbi:MAG: UDP-N-acetylglucosamine--N-acetylmuramyl-(pentapeptide) pyrophosphoryl-undecaprenol N-acetylglucosamine transferase [Candidatus Pacebacteria bacterium]|nr:UDP-N-acetylglucosamine--N-acetylmuramyl-(pentapeptide) pyrophosphoryl-undecaprenol N-acetylglucosamine transferase [Candidatus Paceibacterota bacterium]